MCQYEIVYKEIKQEPVYEEIVRNVFEKCFEEENIQNSKMYITVTFTNPENIQKINKEYRNIDKPTDVLSFPMFEKEEIQEKIKNNDFLHEDIL